VENFSTAQNCISCGRNLLFGYVVSESQSTALPKATSLNWTRIYAWLAGGAIGFYAGLFFLFPAGYSAILWWIANKTLPSRVQLFVPSLSVQIGHMIWFLSGTVITGLLAPADVFEVIIFLSAITWIIYKPSIGAVLFLAAFQVFGIVVNLIGLTGAAVGSIPHKALAVTIIFRLAALLFLWEGYTIFQRSGTVATNNAA